MNYSIEINGFASDQDRMLFLVRLQKLLYSGISYRILNDNNVIGGGGCTYTTESYYNSAMSLGGAGGSGVVRNENKATVLPGRVSIFELAKDTCINPNLQIKKDHANDFLSDEDVEDDE